MIQEKKGDIVQITNIEHTWFPCLIIVDDIKSFGIQGYAICPGEGEAYIRLKKEDYSKVGKAILC